MSEIIGISRNELPPYLIERYDTRDIEYDTPLVAHKNAESLATMTARWRMKRLGRRIAILDKPVFVGFNQVASCEIPSFEMMASQFDDLNGVNIVTLESTCYIKRGGVSTQTVYNIIGKRDTVKPDGTLDVFYELRCPVTGGTIGRLSNDIEVIS